MRVTGSERALQFVLEDFKWYQKRLKIVGAAALTLHSIQSRSRVRLHRGRRREAGRVAGAAEMPFLPRESDSGDWNVITRVSFPERFKEKWLMARTAWLWADLSPQNGSVQIKYPACCPRLQ